MDWRECIRQRIVKSVRKDQNLITSTREIVEIKIESAGILPDIYYIAKISLLYDALREYLESISLEKGYKVYNHECYKAFLKEILNMPNGADMFDKLRRARNSINYYGRKVSEEEAEQVISDLNSLLKRIKEIFDL
ncbi:hypothetical protein GF312_02365 [Candidatus Poribacteria bacterium]|nr:hypothetical protein [Candidatus Poribacteria bacterium]